ncbi:hypothetical protein I600_1857 [Maribacter dokdonensis DSW-8]|nr:hypothetical protein I600_1857 [Maribacter dokdonensis DSW-8]
MISSFQLLIMVGLRANDRLLLLSIGVNQWITGKFEFDRNL